VKRMEDEKLAKIPNAQKIENVVREYRGGKKR
jgi:hypothetical protein